MKKLMLSIGILAALAVVACSEDESVPRVNYLGCQICEIEYQQEFGEQSYEVCFDADGIAYVNNGNTELPADRYFSLFCQNEFEGVVPENPGSSEPGEATDNCVTCEGYTAAGVPVEEYDVCKGTNGNAFVGGEDLGVDYENYIAMQEMFTDCN